MSRGESELPDRYKAAIAFEVSNAVTAFQNELFSNMKAMIDSNFETFRSSMETTQKELSSTQINKMEESILGAYKFKRQGNEAQYRGNMKILAKLQEADDVLGSREVTVDTIRNARERITEERKAKEAAKGRGRGGRYWHPYRRWDHTRPRSERDNSNKPTHRPGNCFACEEKGHWIRDCKAKENDKEISTFSVDHVLSQSLVTVQRLAGMLQSSCHSPVGRLKECSSRLVETGANAHVIDVIKVGYKLPFRTLPSDMAMKNNKSASDNPVFVKGEILQLLEKGCVKEVKDRPKVVNPLTVAYGKSGKPRLVLDCRHINPHLFKFKHKYEDGESARDMFSVGDYVVTFDLKSAYHHIQIYPEHSTYPGFSWEMSGVVRYFVFRVLPFGLATAGFIFTKVAKHFVKHVRSKGQKLIMYLDDGLAGAHSKEQTGLLSENIRSDLADFGFLIADEKCCWSPAQQILWLGLSWDFSTGKVKVF